MPRAKKKPSIEEQLRALIACATEQRRYELARKLIEFMETEEKNARVVLVEPA